MSHLSCPDVRELAAELALGIASGQERAHALAHIATCADCRSLVEEMSNAADSLLLLAPQMEPPVGFESKVMARVAPARRRFSWRWAAAASVIAVGAAAATGAGVHAAGGGDRKLAAQYNRLVKALGGKTLRAAELRSVDGTIVGKVYAYEGQPSWLFLVLQDRDGSGRYDVELEPLSGDTIRLAGLQIKAGKASWATTAAVDIDALRSVNIVDDTGSPIYGAEFSSSK